MKQALDALREGYAAIPTGQYGFDRNGSGNFLGAYQHFGGREGLVDNAIVERFLCIELLTVQKKLSAPILPEKTRPADMCAIARHDARPGMS